MPKVEIIVNPVNSSRFLNELEPGSIFRLYTGDTYYLKLSCECNSCGGNALSLTSFKIYKLGVNSRVMETKSKIMINELIL
jgi:hypothetical protein